MPAPASIPSFGNLGTASQTSVPFTGFLGPDRIAENVWIVRRLFSLGAGQTDGLSYLGLRGRLLGLLGDDPLKHPVLDTENNESTTEQVLEERSMVSKLMSGDNCPFPLDTTMTIIRSNRQIVLHSVVPFDEDLLEEIKALGEVSLFLVPNLQHWLFLQDWIRHFPEAAIGMVPAACDEDLLEKMEFLKDHKGDVFELPSKSAEYLKRFGLDLCHLEGAPLCLNEFLFFHKSSGTLLASDSFYGGYSDSETPTWFARLWFKLTKYGSFRAARLPIYRTSRVVSHGDSSLLLKCAQRMISQWSVEQITFSHGTSPFDGRRMAETGLACRSPGDVYIECWRAGLARLVK